MLRSATALLVAALAAVLAGCGGSAIPAVQAQSSGTPGTVTVSWTAPTENTNGSPIVGTITYTVFEMAPCGGTQCAADTQTLATAATGITGNSAQVSNVPDGTHCYAVQTNVVLQDGANVSSALSTIACAAVAGSSAPQPTPNAPTNVQATLAS